MIWQDRTRTDPTKRKFIDENGNEQNVNIEEIQSNITQSGTPVNATTMNNIEKNLGTYGNDSYDSTATYSIGDVVTHNALLYRAKQDIDTAEEWTAEHWEETSALDELKKTSGNEVLISDDEGDITYQTKIFVDSDTGTAKYRDTNDSFIPLKDNEVIISDTEPTSNDNEIWIDTSSNATYMNQEVNIGATNVSNTPTWFKMSKNLFGAIPSTQTKNGITLTNNGDGTFNLVGTATAQAEFIWWKDTASLGFLYTGNKWGSYVSSSNNNVIYQISTWNGTPSSPVWVSTPIQFSQSQINKSITASNSGVLTRFNIQINNGTTVNLTNIKVSLEATENEVKYNKYLGYSSIVVNGEELYNKPVELYKNITSSNLGGGDTTLFLSDSIANYKKLTIFYDRYGIQKSVDVYTDILPSSNTIGVVLDLQLFLNGIYRLYSSYYTITENTMTLSSRAFWNGDGNPPTTQADNQIRISRIIGYK